METGEVQGGLAGHGEAAEAGELAEEPQANGGGWGRGAADADDAVHHSGGGQGGDGGEGGRRRRQWSEAAGVRMRANG